MFLLSVALFAAILLGDARQSVVDVFIAGAAIAGYFALWKTSVFYKPPKIAMALWAAVLVAAAPLFWRDGIGAATQNFIRYLFGFVVFCLMHAISTEKAAGLLERALIIVGVVVSVFTMVFLFVPQPPWLPLMNLLYPSYGHNHAADILLFVFPLVVYSNNLSKRIRAGVWLVVVCGLVFSFARGAWALLAIYGVATAIMAGIKRKKEALLLAIIFLAALISVHVITTTGWMRVVKGEVVDSAAFYRVVNKGNPLADPRIEYWKQAVRMVNEHPVFGSGPGTFYFGSRRFQSHPSAYSWFAHSFVLQTLAEQGLVGSLPVFFLFGWVLWSVIRFVLHHPPSRDPLGRLGLGVVLVTAYSFIEFNLSFAVVWALFWVIVGLIICADTRKERGTKNNPRLIIPLLLLIVFYSLFIAQSAVFALFPKRSDMAFYLTPFDAVTTQYYAASDAITPRGLIIAAALHKSDAETLRVVAAAWQKLGFTKEALAVYGRILPLDPYNEDNHSEYIKLLIQTSRFDEVAEWFVHYPLLFFPAPIGRQAPEVPAAFIQSFPQEYVKLFDSKFSHEVRYSRFYYNVGLWYLSTEPEKTRLLWGFASLLQPKLSYLWLERMFLERRVFHDEVAAQKIIENCLNNQSAAKHCGGVSIEERVYLPGHYKTEINEK